jgi:glycerol-3-phosphate cytidylyltransferase
MRKVGITCSCFDLLHAGHIKMLEEAKNNCDYLIAALQTDPTIDRPSKNKPVQSLVERYIQLNACVHVDEIIPYQTEEELIEIFRSFNLDVRFIGQEYENDHFTAKDVCEERDIEIHYNKRDHAWSSSKLRNKLK